MNHDDQRRPLDWPHYSGTVSRVLDRVEAKVKDRKRRRRRHCLVAAAAVVLGGFAWHLALARRGPLPSTTSPVVSQPTYKTLPDGSVVDLRDSSQVAVDFTPGIRHVTLEHGEAHFQVAKNAQRPFVVLANGVEVRAVGTAFSVQLGKTDVEVLVTEGRVTVNRLARADAAAPGAGLSPPATSVSALNGLVIPIRPPTGAVQALPKVFPVSETELNERLSWRVPKLEFSSTPLAEALPMINRFSGVRLILGDPELGKVQLSGVLRASNMETLLRLLATDYGIAAERRPDGEIVLRKRP